MKHSVGKDSEENDEAKKRRKSSTKNKMLILLRELCFLILVSLTAYGTVLMSEPKTKKGGPSVPFFRNTNVDDFYQGDLSQLMHEVSSATYSFVFFYAPWDADSQDLKNEFLETAEFFTNQVYFAGVNCWEPGSECRTRFKDVVERYPQLVAYVGLEKAVEYKGPQKSDYMIKFLDSIIHPIVRLNSIIDLSNLRYLHDATVIGHLRINGPYETGLSTLYETALSLATKDYYRRIAFGVFTHTHFNSALNVTGTPTIRLYIWNRKFEYNGSLRRGHLVKWIIEITKDHLISTDGLLTLKQPAVVMFTPMNPLSLINPMYFMLRRVSMLAKNVSTNGTVENDYFSYIISHSDMTSFLNDFHRDIVHDDLEARKSCLKMFRMTQTCSLIPKWDNFTCNANSLRRMSVSEERDLFAIKRKEEECKIFDRVPSPPLSIPEPCQGFPLNISFRFACLDSNLFKHLAEALGIDLSSEPENTSIVVIGEEEMTKVPDIREETLWLVLQNWTRGHRERTVLSSQIKEKSFPANSSKDRVHLPELNLSTFNGILQQTQKHSVILYHSRYCGACARASLVLLELTNLLKDVKCLYLARIDGDKVDVPWHFSLHFFPSLLFLPRSKKSDSRLLPANTPWAFSTLSEFVIANLNIEERPEVVLALCARWGQNPEASYEGTECIRVARKFSVQGIERKLREARRQRDRKALLVHLGFLKAVHLALARVTNISKTLAVIKSLSKDFRVGCSVI